ncbi:MAG: hypothetical protein AAF571_00360 [Verrucomicrobiota bacterium]
MKPVASLFLALFTIVVVHSLPAEVTRGDLLLIDEQFGEVHNQIYEIQMKANETKAVKKAQAKFEETMNKAMLKLDPDIKDDLEQSNKLLEKLREHPQIDNPQAREMNLELKKMLLDFKFLERKLTPARKEAAEAPECKKELERLEEVTMTEMKKIAPNIQELMDKKEELATRYKELKKQVN